MRGRGFHASRRLFRVISRCRHALQQTHKICPPSARSDACQPRGRVLFHVGRKSAQAEEVAVCRHAFILPFLRRPIRPSGVAIRVPQCVAFDAESFM
jgi:hypothetical protein